MAVQIQLRRGTAAGWTSANPTLASGELAVETDTGKVKIGDGATAWNSLGYFAGSGGGNPEWVDVQNKPANITNLDTILDGLLDNDITQTTAISGKQPLDAGLTALAAFNTNGIVTQTANNTFVGRTLTGTTNVITITNGDGVSGNPTVTVGSLVARTDIVGLFTKQQNYGAATLTSSSGSIAWNLDNAQSAKHTMTENTTLANPTNMVDGGTYVLRITQHASSPKTLAFGNAYKWPGGTPPTLTATNGAVDVFTFVSDGTSMFGTFSQDFQ